MIYKKYKKEDEYSYVMGAFPTIELIDSRKDLLREVIISQKFKDLGELVEKLDFLGINYKIDDKALERIGCKGNQFVAGVFNKYEESLEDDSHIVLYKPCDMGNLGTIIRTMQGFSYKDLAVIEGEIDIFDPRVIRASMGAFFKSRIQVFPSIEDYLEVYPDREIFLFMLGEDRMLDSVKAEGKYSLVFGSEGPGLPEDYKIFGKAVQIPQSPEIDSLNLTIAAGVSMFYFARGEGRI